MEEDPNIKKIKNYTVDLKDVVGRGSFGIIRSGTDSSGHRIAAKVIESEKVRHVIKDVSKLLDLNHPNIVQMFDVHQESDKMWIVMEFCEFGDLAKFCTGRTQKLTIDEKLRIMRQITRGIEYLHNKDVIHRDIKPVNILVAHGPTLYVKLTDFDLSKFLDEDRTTSAMKTNVGTKEFKAPEFFMRDEAGNLVYHRNVDIYAAGLTFLALLQENDHLIPRIETPQSDSELHAPIGRLISERKRYNVNTLEIVKDTDDTEADSVKQNEVRKLIRSMTCFKPDDRLPAAEVREKLAQIANVLEVNSYCVNLNEVIHEGKHSTTFSARDDLKQTKTAAKRIDGIAQHRLQRLSRELQVAAELNHENVIQIFDVARQGENVWVMMEYCCHGDFHGYHKAQTGTLSLDQGLSMMVHIAEGLKYIHSQKVLHAKVTPEEILVADEGRIKLKSFSVEKFLHLENELDKVTTDRDAALYTAPELFGLNKAVDIYTAGMVFLEIIQRRIKEGDADT